MAELAVITGGTGGLGKAVTTAFLEREYRVITTYRSDDELKDLLEFIGDKKKRLEAVRVDVTDEVSLDVLRERIKKQGQPVDALVCLVGGFTNGTLGDSAAESFEQMIKLNATSFLLTCNTVVPFMRPAKKEKAGAYRHIVAMAARPALEPVKGIGLYAASKAAVVSLVQTLAKELLSDKITVNALAPSTLDTAANRKAMPKADFKTWVRPEQLAELISMLTSQTANPVSGAIIPVYGQA